MQGVLFVPRSFVKPVSNRHPAYKVGYVIALMPAHFCCRLRTRDCGELFKHHRLTPHASSRAAKPNSGCSRKVLASSCARDPRCFYGRGSSFADVVQQLAFVFVSFRRGSSFLRQ